MTKYKYHLFQSPVGWIALLGSEKGLRCLSLKPVLQEAPFVEESAIQTYNYHHIQVMSGAARLSS